MSTFLTWFLKVASVSELSSAYLVWTILQDQYNYLTNTVFPIGGSIYNWDHKIA